VTQTIHCRLCGGQAAEKFHLRGFSEADLVYFECATCGSLQTQEPTWLVEAYANSNLANTDVGAAQRVLINYAFVLFIAKILRLQTILDFGGGDGLLCRLLRDRGLDAQTVDEHRTSSYARSFEGSLSRYYDLIAAFEVFEHLPHPSDSLDRLFEAQPRFFIASTETYSGQNATWWYLAPRQGQHVFFYSRDALLLIARRHRYSYYAINGWHLFARKPLSSLQLYIISRATRGGMFRLFRATLPLLETWKWIRRDYESVGSVR